MNKFYGEIGFEEVSETCQDVMEPIITWRSYFGDILRFRKYYNSGDKINDDINLSNSVSIMSDSYAFNHLSNIRCIKWLGSVWKITKVEVQYPRLILEMGGLYNVRER